MAFANLTNEFQYVNIYGSNLTSFIQPGSNIIATLTPLYWVLSVIIIIINGFLLALFIRYKSVRKSLNYFILSQIVTDLTVGLVALPVLMILPRQRLVANTSIPNVQCLFALVTPISIMTMMLWGVALTAIDRFIAVFRPSCYKKLITKMRCCSAVISLWVLVLLYYLLPLFNLENLGGYKWRSYCNGIYRYSIGYLHAGVYIHLALPIIVTSAAYISMYVVIRKKHKSSMIQSSTQQVEQGLEKVVTAAKMCLITTVLVIFGWCPFLIVFHVMPIFGGSFIVRLYAYGISILLAATVSALNPLVYFFRVNTIKRILRSYGRCQTRSRIADLGVTDEAMPVRVITVFPNSAAVTSTADF